MTHKDITNLGLKIPKGWRRVRLGELLTGDYYFFEYRPEIPSGHQCLFHKEFVFSNADTFSDFRFDNSNFNHCYYLIRK